MASQRRNVESLVSIAARDRLDLTVFPKPPPWVADAVCATTDPEAFFPEKGGSSREAKNTCRSCTVQAECLDWALDNDERFGIWGGLSERERRRINRALHPTPDLSIPCRNGGCDQTFTTPRGEQTHAIRHCQHDPAIHEESA